MDRLTPLGSAVRTTHSRDVGTVVGYGTLHDAVSSGRGPHVVVLVSYQMASGRVVRAHSDSILEVIA
jgi:hypothetical protein